MKDFKPTHKMSHGEHKLFCGGGKVAKMAMGGATPMSQSGAMQSMARSPMQGSPAPMQMTRPPMVSPGPGQMRGDTAGRPAPMPIRPGPMQDARPPMGGQLGVALGNAAMEQYRKSLQNAPQPPQGGAGDSPITQSGARQLVTMKKGGRAISKAKNGYAEGGMRSESTEAAKAGANKKNAQEQFNDFLKDKGDLNTPQGRADRRVWIARGDEELEKVNAAGRNNYDTKNRTGYYDMDEPAKEYEVSDRLKSSPTSIGKSKGGMAKGGNWIAGATKNKGALHRDLGVPQGEKIPAKKLNAAMKSNNPTIAKRARLAETLNSFKKG